MRSTSILCALAMAASVPSVIVAQDGGSAKPILVAAKKPVPKKKVAKPAGPPAKELFGAAKSPAPMAARAIGFYAKGCLAGAKALPIDGPAWQAMRLSRNRNWGHPDLIAMVEKLALEAREHDGWPGLLVGDMSQPRGGPMLSGHASHQVGLDVDIWFMPMPERRLTAQEREEMSATMIVAEDRLDVDPHIWTPAHTALIKAAAEEPEVERIFVNAAIKKALCREAGDDRAWLNKVRQYWQHDYHFHIRIHCPSDSPDCKPQQAVPAADGCGKDLDWWFTDAVLHPKPAPPTTP